MLSVTNLKENGKNENADGLTAEGICPGMRGRRWEMGRAFKDREETSWCQWRAAVTLQARIPDSEMLRNLPKDAELASNRDTLSNPGISESQVTPSLKNNRLYHKLL